ncbi:N-acetyltransferase [Rhodospirillales bacterium TMPK1]|uniref:N-acetyltransferase n=2 Tax=Roseiterribacter gracilis TaxID=2812848 RepID=A0A8S8XA90_9PROT|nr:N-acetyltransferase [Rhodospirillales bacterium TMPK1]
MNSDPSVMRYFPALLTRAESDASADRMQSVIAERGWGFWALEILGVTEFAGFVGLNEPTWSAHFTPCVEVGWRLATEFQGRGYATEAARAAITYGFENLFLTEIVALTIPANTPSRRVMEKLGMIHDVHGDFDHPRIDPDHPTARHVLYRLGRNASLEK